MGSLHRRNRLSLGRLLLCLCVALGGCAQGFFPRERAQPPATAEGNCPKSGTSAGNDVAIVRLPPVVPTPPASQTAVVAATGANPSANDVRLTSFDAPAPDSVESGTTARFMTERIEKEPPLETVPVPVGTPIAPDAMPVPTTAPKKAMAKTPGGKAESVTSPGQSAKGEPPAPVKPAGKAAESHRPSTSTATALSSTPPAPKPAVDLATPQQKESSAAKPSASPAPAPAPAPPAQEIMPIRVAPQAPPVTASPSDPSVTIHVDNWEVRKTLEILSRQANLNILVSPGVTGTITLDLRDKTVDETLTAISRLCRLRIRRERDVVYVSTIKESNEAEEDDLPVRVYRLNYAKSTDIEAMVKKLLSKSGVFTSSPDSESGLASDAVKAGSGNSKDVKAGGNSMAGGEIVVVQDYEHILKKVDRVIAEIDVQPLQVLIEAVIVSVKLDKNMELGVNFGLLDGAQKTLAVAGSGTALNSAVGFPPAAVITAAGKVAGTPVSGFADATSGLKFGYVETNSTAFIKALESLGETKVLACPRIVVLNKQRAEIHLGDRLGYATTTQTQTSTVQKVEFIDVGTQLRLRPFIASDGIIRMEIHPERSSGVIDTEGIPQINQAQVTTNVMVPNGGTLVIGGLLDDENQHKTAGLPLLSRLPWIGWLFGETDNKKIKKELIVILTPHIWRPDCPEGLNYLGRPRTLCLDARVEQKPGDCHREMPSLYELTRPMTPPCPPGESNATDKPAPNGEQ